jgi:hypothetical protein
MNRILTLAVIAALALPVLALAALVGEQERLLTGARTLSVPLRGYDPRDLLQGHYIFAQFDWDWEREPVTPNVYQGLDGGACVVAEKPKPRLRFVPGWQAGDPLEPNCKLMIAGRAWSSTPPRFTPASLETDRGGVRFYIPEERAGELEKLLSERPGAFTADLAVRPDGSAAVRALRVDGKAIGR